jgi:hypothetical protein
MSVIGFKGTQAGFEQLSPRHHDDIEAGCDLVTTKNLSYESFSAISPDGAAQFLRGRDPQAPDTLIVGQDEDRAESTTNPDSLAVDLFEVRTATNPLVRPQACRRTRFIPRSPWRRGIHSLLTVRRLRPFARRLFSTRRPFFELILTRNPCAFFRRRVFG